MDDEPAIRQMLNEALQSLLLSGDELRFLCAIDLRLRSGTPLKLSEDEIHELAGIMCNERGGSAPD